MGKYFAQDSKLAGLERLMMTPPNFIPCGGGVMLICTINEMAELTQEISAPDWQMPNRSGLRRPERSHSLPGRFISYGYEKNYYNSYKY